MQARATMLGRESIDLARPSFVFALALLLANDLVLKAAYPGWITGKLSDFAGLFVLPYFLAWLWPSRRLALHVGVALAFVAWKLPLSRPFVELWNAAPWFDIARVEDLTDLIALASAGLSWHWTSRLGRRVVHLPSIAIAGIALIAFTATSKHVEAPLRGTYLFEGTPAQLRARLDGAKAYVGEDQPSQLWSIPLVSVSPDDDSCVLSTEVEAKVKVFGDATLVELVSMSGRCEFTPNVTQRVVRAFNQLATTTGLDAGVVASLPPRVDSCVPDSVGDVREAAGEPYSEGAYTHDCKPSGRP